MDSPRDGPPRPGHPSWLNRRACWGAVEVAVGPAWLVPAAPTAWMIHCARPAADLSTALGPSHCSDRAPTDVDVPGRSPTMFKV